MKKAKLFILFESFNLIVSFICALFTPFYRSINKPLSFLFMAIAFAGMVVNFFFIRRDFDGITSLFGGRSLETKKFMLLLFTALICLVNILLVFVLIKLINPNSLILINGLGSIGLLLLDFGSLTIFIFLQKRRQK